MPSKFVVGLRACCIAMALAVAIGDAAESKSPSLVGATREQVLARFGEPKSSIVAGNREVLLFERERVVLRNNVVVEVDLLPTEPARRSAPSVTAETPNAEEAAPPEAAPPEEAPAEKTPSRPPASTRSASAPANSTPIPPAEDAPLEIRAVRRAGAAAPRPAAKAEPVSSAPPTEAIPAPTTSTPAAPPASSTPPPLAPSAATLQPTPGTSTPAITAPDATAPNAAVVTEEAANSPAAEKSDVAKIQESAPAVKQTTAGKGKISRADGEPPPVQIDESVFDRSTYVIAFVLMIGGVGYLIWRSRQRKLELAATAVSRTPFAAPPTATAGARFTAELLAKMEWKRFEELVAAYYGKTGVVAVRTKSGPSSPVHIKISWKGEARPFAFVQCLAHPAGLVEAKPVQELVAVLMAEDIRRGYVVTTGKFSVPARDFAEEKHITLLSGDLLLEKLNALPDGARNELMQEIATGDYATPSCPKCEAKMTRSPDDPTLWRCATHPEEVIPVWK